MAYTLNEPAAVRDARRAGVDVVITDDPAMALVALQQPDDARVVVAP